MVAFSLTIPPSLLTQFCRPTCTACPNKGCGKFTMQNLHSYCNHSAHCLSDTTYYGNVLRNVYWYLNHQGEWPTRKCYEICFTCSALIFNLSACSMESKNILFLARDTNLLQKYIKKLKVILGCFASVAVHQNYKFT